MFIVTDFTVIWYDTCTLIATRNSHVLSTRWNIEFSRVFLILWLATLCFRLLTLFQNFAKFRYGKLRSSSSQYINRQGKRTSDQARISSSSRYSFSFWLELDRLKSSPSVNAASRNDGCDNSTDCLSDNGWVVFWLFVDEILNVEVGRKSPFVCWKTRDNGQLCGSKADRCSLTCMLVHRRSRKTGRYHRSCKSLRLSGTAAPASARPPSLQQNPREKTRLFI